MGTDLFINAHAVYSYAKVSALTRIASALLLSITIFLGWIDVVHPIMKRQEKYENVIFIISNYM